MKIRKNQGVPHTAAASRVVLTNVSYIVKYKPVTATQEVA
jgi:hypothetical protein